LPINQHDALSFLAKSHFLRFVLVPFCRAPSSLFFTSPPPSSPPFPPLPLSGVLFAGVSAFTEESVVEATEVKKGRTHPLVGRNSYHHLITNLLNGDAYNVRVSAYNELGFGSTQLSTPTKLKGAATVPQTPTNVDVTGVSARTVSVSWDPPVSDGGHDIESYLVEWDTVNSFASQCGDKIEIQKLEISRPTSSSCQNAGECTFKISLAVGGNNFATACVAWDILPGDLETEIRGLDAAFDDVAVSGCGADSSGAWNYGYAHTIRFEGSGAQENIGLMEIDFATCSADDVTVSATPIQDGRGLKTGCDAAHLKPPGRIQTGSDATSCVIEGLTPGIPVFVRVSAQNTLGLSPPAVMGYPLGEVSAAPFAVPEPLDYVGLSTDDAGRIHVEWTPPPFTKLEGNNGNPILGYNVMLASRIVEEQIVSVRGDLGMFTLGQYQLQFGLEVTACLDVHATALEVEQALELLESLDDVSVTRVEVLHGFEYLVRFVGDTQENGDVVELSLAAALCTGEGSTLKPEGELLEDVVQIRTKLIGQRGMVPEIVEITTSADAGSVLLSGKYQLSYDYIGHFTQAVTTVRGDPNSSVEVTVEKGSRIASTSADLRPLLRRGQTVKIGDEILTVDTVGDFTCSELPLSSYHVVGAAAVNIYIMDNIIGFVKATKDATSVTTSGDYSTSLLEGQFIWLDNDVYAVSSIDATSISLGDPLDHTQSKQYVGDTDTHVLLLERKKIEVDFDESEYTLDAKIESLPGVGSVDVSRVGPDRMGSFTWSVTFTSSTASSSCIQGQPACLTVENSRQLLGGTNPAVETKRYQEGISPSFNHVASRHTVASAPFEVQIIRVQAEADDLDGKFVVEFPTCAPLYTSGNPDAAVASTYNQKTLGSFVRPNDTTQITLYYSVSGEDLQSALESLHTIGIVKVDRKSIEFGFEWTVSFASNAGNLPLLSVNGDQLLGTNPSIEVVEQTKGAYLDSHLVLTGLPLDRYAARVSAFNKAGSGADTLEKQATGTGVVPFTITNSRPPSTISTASLVLEAISSSEVMVKFTPPESNGEPITKYLLEWTSDEDFGTSDDMTGVNSYAMSVFSIQNSHATDGKNDTDGWFTLSYGSQITTILNGRVD
jgi:hypothetical protein